MAVKKKTSELLEEAVFVGPAVLFFFIIMIIPFLMGIGYSFTQWNGASGAVKWIGIDNFKQILSDEGYKTSFIFTVKYTVASVILTNVIAFTLALMLSTSLKLKNVYRTIFFLPNVVSGLLLGFIWQFIFVKGFAAIGAVTGIGFFQLPWLGDGSTGFWAMIIVTIWQTTGYYMIIYIAGLTNVPSELIEAASIDGASYFQTLKNVTIPLIMPSFTVCFFLSIANSFKMFDLNFALTHGGPYNSTKMVALDIYNEAFQNNAYGLGTAKALIFFVIVAVITTLQVRFTKNKEVQL